MMEKSKRNIGPLLIILAGCFWGSMGIFVRRLSTFGFSPIQIVSLRITVAALVFSLLLLIKDSSGFRIALRDLPLFLGLGFGSILFFTICYFSAITIMPLSTAAILLYTSPIWIMLMSVLFFREKLNRIKLIALALAFAGCVLVSGISGEGLTLTGLLLGLGSGIGYGLYSILGTIALRKYSPYTVTTYTFLFAAAGSWLVCQPADMISKISATDNLTRLLLFCVLTGLVTAVIPFLAYTLGLRTVEASRAGILATIEPLVATLVGIVVFSEPLTLLSGLGIALILAAVVLLNRKQPIENKVYEKEV
jgi:drug/metabolite transporter (DMT)-like permease